MADLEDLVTIVGVVHHVTSLGVFLEVGDRRVFVGRNCMELFSKSLEPVNRRLCACSVGSLCKRAWRKRHRMLPSLSNFPLPTGARPQ